ncbi:tellurite resistance TerB family protein [Hoeflea alexandrii]|nr:tellurite resistance TerB family protein [Hoeflea alexandrii]MCY0150937.1 tellurite resistance TerB family protein [Hoeflea alexandrii]
MALLLGTKTGRKMGKSALKLGGLALIAALAYRAWQNWTSKAEGPVATTHGETPKSLPAPDKTAFLPARADEQQRIARNILRAMVAAAKADGHIDSEEFDRIHNKMDKLDLGASEKAFVMDELRAPADLARIAREARTREEAAEIYAASLFAIDGTKPGERAHLAQLAELLGLDDALVTELEASVCDVVVAPR